MESENGKKTILSQNSTITLGMVMLVIGAVVWMVNVWSVASAAKDLAENNRSNVKEVEQVSNAVLERMARIETKMDILIDQTQ
jgi:hypothetical protein